MYFLLLFVCVPIETRTCNISEPIGCWLEKHKGPCDVINGHFILDINATNITDKLFFTFSGLKRIEGCILIKGYTGLQNVSFFSKLEDINCDENEANAFNITNVIDVEGRNFTTMGFRSLQKVIGPGEIKIFFTPRPREYYEKPCFSREELKFLAYHRQFRGEMYLPCNTTGEDKCFRLDLYGPRINISDNDLPIYSFADIPDNCTAFFGALSILGTIGEEQVKGRFDNLKLVIGHLNILGTLITRLDEIFPKLEIVYPYYFLTTNYDYNRYARPLKKNTTMPQIVLSSSFRQDRGSPINDYIGYYNFQSVQLVHARINRFLTNWSIPTLKPIRPLDVDNVLESNKIYLSYFNWLFRQRDFIDSFLPDTVDDPCRHFPQFKNSCGPLYTPSYVTDYYPTQCYPYENQPVKAECAPFEFHYETWLLSMICVAFGLLFSCRAMILLLFSKAVKSLSHLRTLLLLPIFISTMVALENSLIQQKPMRLFGPSLHFLPQFESVHLFHPLSQFLMLFLAASKHACLPVIVFGYVLTVIFSATRSHRLSLLSCILVLISFPVVAAYLNSQIFLAIRGVRPRYSQEPWQLIYIPFIMSSTVEPPPQTRHDHRTKKITNFVEAFSRLLPDSMMIIQNTDKTLYSPTYQYLDFGDLAGIESDIAVYVVDFPLETFGQLLPQFTRVCDIGIAIATVLFLILSRVTKFISCFGLMKLLILLYLQLSINRVRFFIHDLMLVSDYCNPPEFNINYRFGNYEVEYLSCYDAGQQLHHSHYDENGNQFFYDYYTMIDETAYFIPPVMKRYQWDIVERFFEMLPYTSYLLVSYYGYKFASFLGVVIHHKEIAKGPAGKQTTIFTRSTQQTK